MTKLIAVLSAALVTGLMSVSASAAPLESHQPQTLWLKAHATNKFERSAVAATGASIEITRDDYVIAIGNEKQRKALTQLGVLDASFNLPDGLFDFPTEDSNFHDYERTKAMLVDLVARHPKIASLDSIGKSIEGRELFHLHISGDMAQSAQHPGVIFMGGHHAREHLSVEIPLLLAQRLLDLYDSGDADVKRLVDTRDIHIIPMVNPDGAEYDISGGQYHMWRKNRSKNADGTEGVDLNRNYGFGWGTGGSSTDGNDETYMGQKPFSEPETQAIKAFVDRTSNATVLLSFHTFSELVLYPWGHSYDKVPDPKDVQVFEKMATTMASWNGYKPEQASSLYIASGDTTDWAYGEHKIFAFTFELDPTSMWEGGFYPGQSVIAGVFEKNWKPCVYMMDLADNPYRSIQTPQAAYGLSTPLVR